MFFTRDLTTNMAWSKLISNFCQNEVIFLIKNKHNKDMKKIILIFLCVCFSFCLVGCESDSELRVAHISDITTANSTNYAVKVVLDQDKRVEQKYVDLQIMVDKPEQVVNLAEENKDKTTLVFEKENYWYNLCYLTKGDGENDYQKYADFGTKIFNITVPNDVRMKFRVVAGDVKQNSQTEEKILVLSEDISKTFTLNAKANKKN